MVTLLIVVCLLSDVSLLQVFVKPDSKPLNQVRAVFAVKENKDDKWINHILQVPELAEPFQVIMKDLDKFTLLLKFMNVCKQFP